MFEKYANIPIWKKAEEIFKLIEALGSVLPEDDDYIQSSKEIMLADIMIISSKIVGAEAGNEYTIRMQNAAIIRHHAMSLHLTVGSLRMHESFTDHDYVKVIRKEIDDFRELFVAWKNGFDASNHYWDELELFNPPNAIKPDKEDFDDHFDLDEFKAFMENITFEEDEASDDEDLDGDFGFDDEDKK